MVGCALALAAPASARGPVVTTDLLRVRSVSSIDVAADGARAVFAVRSIEEDGPGGAPVNVSHLYVLDLRSAGTAPRRFTSGRRSDRAPRLSPDGRTIAFLRDEADVGGDHAGDGGAQVWLIPVDGGEARPAAQFEHGVAAVEWAPDGRRLLVTSAVPAGELEGAPPFEPGRPGRAWNDVSLDPDARPRPDGTREEIRAWLAANAADGDPVVITRLRFQDERSLEGPLSFRQLFIASALDSSEPPRRLTGAFRDHRSAVFMPDGRSVLYTAFADDAEHPDRQTRAVVRRIDVESAEDRVQLDLEGWSIERPRPSRDGSIIAFAGSRADEPAFRPERLGIVSANGDGAEPVWLTDESTFDASVGAFAWMPSRSSLLFNAAVRGGFPLMTMGMGLLEPSVLVERENGLEVGVHAFAAGGGAIVYTVTSAANPCVLRVRDGRGDRMVMDLNEWTRDRTLSTPVAQTVVRPDGTEVEYWLMEPTRRSPTRTYPLAVEVHGGPSAMWGPGEMTMWHEFQLLCSWGYGVLFANPRGSGGYGYAFQRANFQNWGDGPAGDVLAAVDDALRREWIDPERLVLTGGSYGGYLTAWIVAHDHRFRAAVAQRGVYDLETFYGEGNAWRLVEWSMGGVPWDPRVRTILQRESPFTWISRIRTPLLIMHASRDLRTGVAQSEMMYRGLQRLGRPVEYVRYPGAGHDLSRTGDPRQRMDRLDRIVEFFERFIENPRRAPRSDGGE